MQETKTKTQSLLIAAAYLTVVLIWSTTPLAIKWSGEGVSFLFGIVFRMAIGAITASIIGLLIYRKIPMDRASCKAYLAAAVAVFGGMMPVYWAAQYISSGLISVIFGITPMVTGFFAWRFIQEQGFNRLKVFGSLLGLVGLAIIFINGASFGTEYLYGIIAVVVAVMLHSASSVWIKSINSSLPPIILVAGALLFSMPLFIAVYLIFSPPLPQVIPVKAIWSIVYLGIIGSVIGFVSYYYLLKHMPASSVALITLITPITALFLGNIINNEIITTAIYIGTALVLLGLLLHQSKLFVVRFKR